MGGLRGIFPLIHLLHKDEVDEEERWIRERGCWDRADKVIIEER